MNSKLNLRDRTVRLRARIPGDLPEARALTLSLVKMAGRRAMERDWSLERSALFYSILLHVMIVLAAIIGIPAMYEPPRVESPPVFEVELAKLADRTVQKPKPLPAPPAPEPPKAAEPAPPPKPAQAAPEPPKPEVVEPLPAPKVKPKPEPEKPAFDPKQIAALLDKRMREQTPPTPAPPQPVKEAAPAPAASPETLTEPLSISEMDLIRAQFERCWNPPVGAREAQNLVIRVRVALNPDGSLAQAPELIDQSRMSDGFWRAAAESALRAVHKCQPLQDLPTSKYQRWRLIDLTFDPKEMLG